MSEKIVITEEKILKYLPDKTEIPFYIYNTVDSTNNIAKELAKGDVKNAVVISHHQNAGRGRRGRSFFSPDGCGIYMSLLLRTDENAEQIALMTSASAVAVAEAIEKLCDKSVGIKWINDIYIDGKKACGILCESVFSENSGRPEYTVVGIGINLISPNGFPEEIASIATSVFGDRIPDEDIPSELCAMIAERIFDCSRTLSKKDFLKKYKEKSIVLGREITVHSASESYPATAVDIDDDCHLIVRLNDGTKRLLSSGEISTKI